MTSEEAQAQHLIEWATQIAKAAYLIGFKASGEGWNGEYPFEGVDATVDAYWLERREKTLSPLISKIKGEN